MAARQTNNRRYRVRPMTVRQYAAVHRLWQRTEGVGLSDADSRPNVQRFLRRNPNMSFVALFGHQVVGAVLCGHDGRRGYLHHLAVEPSHRQRGLGRKLVEACLSELAKAGIQKCNIFVYAHHRSGESFWRHTGWLKRADLRVMQKPIPPSLS